MIDQICRKMGESAKTALNPPTMPRPAGFAGGILSKKLLLARHQQRPSSAAMRQKKGRSEDQPESF
ncbi:hypothetical protein MOK15_16170 [Sphingobium sp. BYY-5]|uniref:hypothetical protein n=1 Tax=Sphingobium sp. BYY-5 TaxID=2926400 RepID=UPI001FA6DB15|nr:hypothetical protein [Sphingobium sp. BYY-5]MCI4591620.1 hypothetical protein [Sphingobium sp. BYY-5]